MTTSVQHVRERSQAGEPGCSLDRFVGRKVQRADYTTGEIVRVKHSLAWVDFPGEAMLIPFRRRDLKEAKPNGRPHWRRASDVRYVN